MLVLISESLYKELKIQLSQLNYSHDLQITEICIVWAENAAGKSRLQMENPEKVSRRTEASTCEEELIAVSLLTADTAAV